MRRIRTVEVLPTMFTLGNLVCGFFAIVVASRIEAPRSEETPTAAVIEFRQGPLAFVTQFDRDSNVHNAMLCCLLIFLAMLFDALDGHLARLAKATSDFGAQLDSLSDLVTFGVAPAILLVKVCPRFAFFHREAIWVIAASFAACAALRLARFNVETGREDDHMHFSGLPSPAAAAAIASFAILFYALRRETNNPEYATQIDNVMQLVLPFFALIAAALMVSRIPYPHVVNQLFRGRRGFGHIVALVFALVAVMLIPWYSIPFLCSAFVAVPPIRYAVLRFYKHRAEKEPIF